MRDRGSSHNSGEARRKILDRMVDRTQREGDAITTNGRWSAGPVTTDHPEVSQVGVMIHYHIDGKIHRQFAHFTRTRGVEEWGISE